jgi:phage terminase small subunit
MGRGRAKAKQQKVARDLKYSSQFTDLDALQRELGSSPSGATETMDEAESDDESDDHHDEYDESDADDWSATGR